MKYFVLEGEGVHPIFPIENEPNLPGGPWYHGRKLKLTVPSPLEYTLKSVDPGYLKELEEEDELEHDDLPSNWNMKYIYDCEAIPAMRIDLLKILQGAGVNNLETFPARILDPNSGKVHDNYVAFNVIGLVAAADLGASTLMHEDAEPSILDTDFDGLVIDEEKAKNFHLFRLAESCSAICVSEKIKEAIESAGIPGLVFYGPGEWSG